MGSLNSDLIRGKVDTILLKCLAGGDMYGIEICNIIKEASGGTYVLKQPTLYSALRRLENSGLISSYWRDSAIGGRRHYYKLTEAGKNSLESKTDEWNLSKEVIDTIIFDRIESRNAKCEVSLTAQQAVQEKQPVLSAVGLEGAASSIEQAGANLAELDRVQNSRYEQLFTNARKHFLSNTQEAAIGDYVTVPLFGELPAEKTISAPQTAASQIMESYFTTAEETAVKTKELDETKNEGLLKYLSPREYDAINAERNRMDMLTAFAERKANIPHQERVEIRPYVKHFGKKSGSYVLYNKLRLVCAVFVGLMLAAGLGTASVLLKNSYTASEQTFFIFGWAAALFYVLFNAAFYTAYPKHKCAMGSRKWDLVKRTVLTAAVACTVLGISLVAGLSGINAADFAVYCTVPCIIGSAFFLEGVWLWTLKKLPVFSA